MASYPRFEISLVCFCRVSHVRALTASLLNDIHHTGIVEAITTDGWYEREEGRVAVQESPIQELMSERVDTF